MAWYLSSGPRLSLSIEGDITKCMKLLNPSIPTRSTNHTDTTAPALCIDYLVRFPFVASGLGLRIETYQLVTDGQSLKPVSQSLQSFVTGVKKKIKMAPKHLFHTP
jgi:hypothetical protein